MINETPNPKKEGEGEEEKKMRERNVEKKEEKGNSGVPG
jgi:hypothetical protein